MFATSDFGSGTRQFIGTYSVDKSPNAYAFDIGSVDSRYFEIDVVTRSADTPGHSGFNEVIFGGAASVIPIPAAVWLFGSALAGLGWMRRKQTL